MFNKIYKYYTTKQGTVYLNSSTTSQKTLGVVLIKFLKSISKIFNPLTSINFGSH